MAKDDINFDELDKAVNSVLQQQVTPTVSSAASPTPLPDDNQTADQGEAANELPAVPPVDNTADTSAPAGDETTERVVDEPDDRPSSAITPPKRRGQFMDVIRPGDAKSGPQTINYAARRPSTIKPLNPEVVENTTDEVIETSKPLVEPETTEPSGYIDPIDQAEAVDKTVEDADNQPASLSQVEGGFSSASEDQEESPADNQSSEPETTGADDYTPPTNPFISGADVEKRPLGAYADEKQDSIPAQTETSENTESEAEPASDVETESASAPEPSLPAELSSEVVSVEADDLPNADYEKGSPAVDNSAMGTQSITPQYKPQPTEEDADEHPVFDTKQYHQPLTPPAKAHSGGKVLKYILLAIFVLAIGAAGGYAVFILKLI